MEHIESELVLGKSVIYESVRSIVGALQGPFNSRDRCVGEVCMWESGWWVKLGGGRGCGG